MSLNIKHFIDLSIDIIIDILTIWLEIKDVCKLDTAMNNKKERVILLNILKSNMSIFNGIQSYIISNINNTYLKWIVLREIKIKRLNIRNCYEEKLHEIELILKLNSKSLVNLEIINSDAYSMGNYYNPFIDSNISSFNKQDFLHSLISNNCKQILYLKLHLCVIIDDNYLINIAENLINLKKLDICVNRRSKINITDNGIIKIANNLLNLEELSLFSCRKITDTSIFKIAESLTKLNNLNLYSCQQITDNSIDKIAENLTNIEVLNLGDCELVKNNSLIKIAKKCKNLKVFTTPSFINKEIIFLLMSLLPNCIFKPF